MADYIPFAPNELVVDAPITVGQGLRFANNPTAIAEGASGAPRITNSALMQPVAGITNLVGRAVSGSSSSSTDPRVMSPNARPIRSGRVTFRITLSGSGSGRAAIISINGVNVVTENTNGTYTSQQTLNVGDTVLYRVESATGSTANATFEMLIGNDAPLQSL